MGQKSGKVTNAATAEDASETRGRAHAPAQEIRQSSAFRARKRRKDKGQKERRAAAAAIGGAANQPNGDSSGDDENDADDNNEDHDDGHDDEDDNDNSVNDDTGHDANSHDDRHDYNNSSLLEPPTGSQLDCRPDVPDQELCQDSNGSPPAENIPDVVSMQVERKPTSRPGSIQGLIIAKDDQSDQTGMGDSGSDVEVESDVRQDRSSQCMRSFQGSRYDAATWAMNTNHTATEHALHPEGDARETPERRARKRGTKMDEGKTAKDSRSEDETIRTRLGIGFHGCQDQPASSDLGRTEDGISREVEATEEVTLPGTTVPTEPPHSHDGSSDTATNTTDPLLSEVHLAALVDTMLQGPNNLLPPLPQKLLLLKSVSFDTGQRREQAELMQLALNTMEDLLWRTVIRANYFWERATDVMLPLPAHLDSLPPAQQRLELAVQESKRMGRDQPSPAHRAAVEQAVQSFLHGVDFLTVNFALANRALALDMFQQLKTGEVRDLSGLQEAVWVAYRDCLVKGKRIEFHVPGIGQRSSQ